MSDTFITIVAIILAAVLVFVVPLMTTAQRVDDVSQTDVETLTSNFIDEIRATGKLTADEYSKFLESLAATGNTYDVSIEFKILDENPGKKSTQTTKDKIGENVYYSIYTTQIEEVLNDESQGNAYNLKQGDMISVTVRNTNLTLGQQLKNFGYKIVGNDTYTISASKSGMIVGNGSTEIILSDSDSAVNQDKITYTLKENNANGKIIKPGDWTNQDVYVELSKESTYNLELFYYYRTKVGNTEDYANYYTKLDGNSLIFDNTTTIQAYWKSSALEKYSNIETININIDRIKPTIGSISGSTQITNTGVIDVNNVVDTGGSGIYGYYYAWTDPNVAPSPPTSDLKNWTMKKANNFTISTSAENNNKKCTVWVIDKAGNISEPKSAIVKNVVPRITKVEVKDAIIKVGETAEMDVNLIGGTSYKSFSGSAKDYSIATLIAGTNKVFGNNAGRTQITYTITNYDGTTVTGTGTLTVVGITYSPNGGNYVLNYNNGTTGASTIKTTVTIAGADTAKYAWSTSKTIAPTSWSEYDTNNGGLVTKTSTSATTYYLWSKITDLSGNTTTFVSNSFVITSQKITITPSTTSWTNSDITCKIKYTGSNTTSTTMKVGYGATLKDAIEASKTVTSSTTSITATENGYVYAAATDAAGNIVATSLAISNIDKIAPTDTDISINGGTNITTDTSTRATVVLKDNESKVDISSCKWVYNTISTEIGTDDNEYTGGTFGVNPQTIKLNTTTAGIYYVHVLTVDNAGNKKETISKSVTVSYPLLVDKVNVGDYVAYNATNNYSYTSPTGTGSSHGNGYANQKFTSNSSIKWRVLSTNTSTGEVVLISEAPIQTDAGANFYMKGGIGYLYAEQELNSISAIYGHGTGANTSKTFSYVTGDLVEGTTTGTITGSGARSINVNDINKITGVTPSTALNSKYGTSYTHTIYYPTKKTSTGKSTSTASRKYTYTKYQYIGSKYLTDTTSIMYKMLFRNTSNSSNINYWLASRCVDADPETNDNYDVTFSPFCIYNGYMISFAIFLTTNSTVLEQTGYRNIRPVVYLKTTVQTSGQDSNGVWTIIDN